MTPIIVPATQYYSSNNQPTIQNNYNFSIAGNSHINAVNAENATDNSSNTFSSMPTEIFSQIRSTLNDLKSEHKQQLLDILAEIEAAKDTGDKNKCGNFCGQFLSLASIADCITVAQFLVTVISWLSA